MRIRLTRMGRKKRPHYRVVVAERRWARDGRPVAELGHYNPLTEPSTIVLDVERTEEWIRKGAQPTERVGKLLEIARAAQSVGVSAAKAEPPPTEVAEPVAEAPAEAAEGLPAEVTRPAAAKAKAKAEAKVKAKAEAKAKTEPKPKAKAVPKSKAKAKIEAKAVPKSRAKAQAEPDETGGKAG